jgi:hypothetical protein
VFITIAKPQAAAAGRSRRPQPQAYDLVNAIPEKLLIGFQCNLAILFLHPCFFAEKLLVDLDLL